MKFFHTLVAVSCLALASCANTQTIQPNQTAQITSPTVNAYIPKNPIGVMGITPKSIDLFVYSNSTVYETEDLGYSLKYIAPSNMHADVYIFPVPEVIRNKPHQEIVEIMTINSIGDIKEAENRGMYQDFQIIDQHLVEVDGKSQGRMYGTFTVRGENASTAVYVTEQNGKLFKIRITQPGATYDRSIASLWDNFANRMFKFLRANQDQA